jgi:hypothetical protein
VLALQNEVSQKVAAALALKLFPAERAGLENATTVNADAYDAFLKGTKYWLSLTKNDLDTAENYFNLALPEGPELRCCLPRDRPGLGLPPADVHHTAERGRPAAENQFLDEVSEHPGEGGEG